MVWEITGRTEEPATFFHNNYEVKVSYFLLKKVKYRYSHMVKKIYKVCDHLEIQKLLTLLTQKNINFFPSFYVVKIEII